MKSFKEFLNENDRNDYHGWSLYHGHNDRDMGEKIPYPHKRSHIFASHDKEDAEQYGSNLHSIHVRKGLNQIDFTDTTFGKDKISPVVKSLKKKFGKEHPNIEHVMQSGTLWRHKTLESKVIPHLIGMGYHHIILPDQKNEEGENTESHIIHDPQKNVFVDRKEQHG